MLKTIWNEWILGDLHYCTKVGWWACEVTPVERRPPWSRRTPLHLLALSDTPTQRQQYCWIRDWRRRDAPGQTSSHAKQGRRAHDEQRARPAWTCVGKHQVQLAIRPWDHGAPPHYHPTISLLVMCDMTWLGYSKVPSQGHGSYMHHGLCFPFAIGGRLRYAGWLDRSLAPCSLTALAPFPLYLSPVLQSCPQPSCYARMWNAKRISNNLGPLPGRTMIWLLSSLLLSQENRGSTSSTHTIIQSSGST